MTVLADGITWKVIDQSNVIPADRDAVGDRVREDVDRREVAVALVTKTCDPSAATALSESARCRCLLGWHERGGLQRGRIGAHRDGLSGGTAAAVAAGGARRFRGGVESECQQRGNACSGDDGLDGFVHFDLREFPSRLAGLVIAVFVPNRGRHPRRHELPQSCQTRNYWSFISMV